MTKPHMQAANLVAIDVHVHLEAQSEGAAADAAATKYFGESGAGRDPASLAEYYRSRRIGCVVFTVDERLRNPADPHSVRPGGALLLDAQRRLNLTLEP